MDAKLQAYIDKLNKLNFKEMYNGDFFLTWEKTDDEIEAVFTVADALRYMRENNISTKIFESGLGISLFRDNSTPAWASPCSATTPPVPASPSPPPATCWAWRSRTWTRARARSLTARPSVRPPTWCPSWPTSSASATTCTSARATPTCTSSWTP